jgi:hypothetical protein
VGSGLAGIAAEGAISAIVAAEVGEWNENFSGIGDYADLEAVASASGGGKKLRQLFVVRADPAARGPGREWDLQLFMQYASRIESSI